MTEPRGILDPADILHDLEGSEKLAAQFERFSSDAAPAPAAAVRRDMRLRKQPVAGEPARPLLARRPAAMQARYRSLFLLERQFGPGHEFAFLIGPTCQVIEAELMALLVGPARGIAERLLAALAADRNTRKQAEILGGWAAARVPPTFGHTSLVLLALRRGLEQGDAAVSAFLAAHFCPEYAAALRANSLGRCVDRLRETYRNPACHGTGSFTAADCEQFARLAVASQRFADWESQGAELAGPRMRPVCCTGTWPLRCCCRRQSRRWPRGLLPNGLPPWPSRAARFWWYMSRCGRQDGLPCAAISAPARCGASNRCGSETPFGNEGDEGKNRVRPARDSGTGRGGSPWPSWLARNAYAAARRWRATSKGAFARPAEARTTTFVHGLKPSPLIRADVRLAAA